jgi:phosphoserine phosphatase
MPESRDIVAVIFDFDGTLVPDSITGLLRKHSIDPKKFWMQDAQKLVKEGYDPVHAYLNLLLRNIGTDKPLGKLTSADLRRFGSTLDKFYYPGIPRIFQDLQRKAKPYGVDVEYYIVSSGLQEIIEGSRITKEYFKAVYGSRLAGDNDKGMLKYIKRCITYTEKTRYLFEINKGVSPSESHRDFVNEEIPMEKRRIPFSNMVYVGDGLTDIPCFSLVKTGVRNLPG